MVITGTIRVIEATDKKLPIKLTINDEFQAIHIGDNDNAEKPSDECASFGTSMPSIEKFSGYSVTFSWAVTPVLSSFKSDTIQLEDISINPPNLGLELFFNGINPINAEKCSSG